MNEHLPAELQARLAAIMAARPVDSLICQAHWLAHVEGAERVEVLSCACRPAPVEHHRGERLASCPGSGVVTGGR